MYTGSSAIKLQGLGSNPWTELINFKFLTRLRLHGFIWGFCFGAESFKAVSVNIALRTQYDSQGYGFDRASGPYPMVGPVSSNLSSGPPVCIRNRIGPLADKFVARFVLREVIFTHCVAYCAAAAAAQVTSYMKLWVLH
ncbi:hypothetical protein BY996DRAFT_6414354 [Phakopsora pachyrhizi]|nr:hypothetical protein BY996DRAFT_6414354 [Phakopsora pachyrhizi]